jgi:hypothetical protein
LESLDEPEAKASMIWIIGEYAERIDNADELLETFLETFPEETSMVRAAERTGTLCFRLAVWQHASGWGSHLVDGHGEWFY